MKKSLVDSASRVKSRTSLVVQWLKVHLSMQATRVRSLVREDSTSHGAAKPMHHNYRAHSLEPTLCKRRHHNEKPAPQVRAVPILCNWRKALTVMKTQQSQE